MFCVTCNTDVHDCTCPDIDDRLRELTGASGPLLARWCLACDKHYARCRCTEPLFGVRTGGKTMNALFTDGMS